MASLYEKYKLEIRKYQPEDHEQVREVFSNGITEHAMTAIIDGVNGTRPRTRIFHFSVFLTCLLLGISYSTFLNGIYFFLVFEALHMSAIYYLFKAYVESVFLIFLLAFDWTNLHINAYSSIPQIWVWPLFPHFVVNTQAYNILLKGPFE